MSAARRIFVVGGSGYLGQAVCSSALSKGWEVLSLSRHGAPTKDTVHDISNNPVSNSVKWIRGDALKPETFEQHLAGCSAVVHSVGIILETNYKKLVNIGYNTSASHEAATFERANRDTALSVARAARNIQGLNTIVYMSAADVMPILNPRYISTKREVEDDLLAHKDQMRPVVLRPGLIYSSARPLTLAAAAGVNVFNALYHRSPLGCVLKHTPLAKAASPAIHRDVVARAIINAIDDSQVSGILTTPDIERIGNAHN
ncbi:hypothetical protein GGI25_002474 [Coemansia spiralis]|uniref:NAD(P)-binding domain-containing protein n=2 Tax=Coemansia TaxID=4863 RepID=A0A9W8KZC0_9FUNG|nr:hypothetical protein BX070DRAFT_223695 [Coemansia spiralis]KAJ1995412.1 hypothetical protein EDC05_000964 [Coemansia umbellata]KAJ2624760.1 hypothetical protein GGI26_001176 [Coemansia sp. RSA 1358]KAJ2678302.1 hypothetical protein GGI25_002474 [Coemansia spiralis]